MDLSLLLISIISWKDQELPSMLMVLYHITKVGIPHKQRKVLGKLMMKNSLLNMSTP